MPAIRKSQPAHADHSLLAADLAREISLNRDSGPEDAPIIIQEPVRGTARSHITVIWDRWAVIDPETRGQIILDAFRDAKGEPEMLNITVALGPTRQEATRLGISCN